MKTIILLVFFLAVVHSQARSWSGVGNGGFILECDGKKQLFDYYEASQKGLQINHEIPGETLEEKLDFLFSRLKSVDPNRYLNYRFQYNNYWLRNQKILNSPIFKMDSKAVRVKKNQVRFGLGKISIPDHCTLNLVIQQDEPKYTEGQRSGRFKVTLFGREWNSLDDNLKASLIMHELFYRENILRRIHFTSQKIRRLNALLASTDFKNMTQEKWNKTLIDSHFYPMFPNFTPENVENDQLDLEISRGSLPGYKIHHGLKTKFRGIINIDSLNQLNVVAESPLFLLGIYPEYFSLQNERRVDLSFMSDRQLVLGIEPNCLFHLGFSNSIKQPSLISIGIDQAKKIDNSCSAYLEDTPKYQHDKLKYNGLVNVVIERNSLAQIKSKMTLTETPFGIIEILLGGEFKSVQSAVIDLTNGNIIDIKL